MRSPARRMLECPEDLFKIVAPALEHHEAKRSKPYDDTNGKPIFALETGGKITIGIGRNLCDRGLTEEEIYYLFNNDVDEAYKDARRLLGKEVFDALTLRRQAVMLNMAFNLGFTRLAGFVNTVQAVREGRYADAARGMRLSKWAQQVGMRAVQLIEMMENG